MTVFLLIHFAANENVQNVLPDSDENQWQNTCFNGMFAILKDAKPLEPLNIM